MTSSSQPRNRKRKRNQHEDSSTAISLAPNSTTSRKCPEDSALCNSCQKYGLDDLFSTDAQVSFEPEWQQLQETSTPSTCDLCRILVFMKENQEATLVKEYSFSRWRYVHGISTISAAWAFSESKLPSRDITNLPLLVFQSKQYSEDYLLGSPSGSDILLLANAPKKADRKAGARLIGPKYDAKVVQSWLDCCDKHHEKHCQTPLKLKDIRLTVIDCQNLAKLELVDLPENDTGYVTLSYVWGKASSNENMSLFSNSIYPLGSLPRTIRDAVSVVNDLGFRYLWVDRYCVPQDAAEKHTTIMNMDVIYGCAVLTIIAAEGEDPHHGLPGVSETRTVAQQCVQIGDKTLALIPTQDIEEQVTKSLWNSRGWTFQEAIMSRRRLVFTSRIVYFQCDEMRCFEDLEPCFSTKKKTSIFSTTIPLSIPTIFPARGVGARHQDYFFRVGEFFQRTLTYDQDGFNAFQGIAHRFESNHIIANIFGVPVHHSKDVSAQLESVEPIVPRMVHGLSWYFRGYIHHNGTKDQCPVERRKELPSWTWAGWKRISDVRDKGGHRNFWLPQYSKNVEFICSGLEIQFSNGTTDKYTVQDSSIHSWKHLGLLPKYISLCGLLVPVHLKDQKVGDCRFHMITLYSCDHSKVFSNSKDDHSHLLHGLVLCRFTNPESSTVFVMLLEDIRQEDRAIYERIGMLEATVLYDKPDGDKGAVEMLLMQQRQWVTLA